MQKIDAHQHFWKYNTNDFVWMDDRMDFLKNDFLPVQLIQEQGKTGFSGSIAVQARQMEEENEFLLNLANKYAIIKGIVGWIDLQANNFEERLNHYSKFEKFKGIRHVIHDEPDVDFMLRPAFLNGISKLADYKLTYDILIFPKHLPNTIKFIEKFPGQKFVIDHLAKPLIKEQVIEPWKENIKIIAEFENVYCKISGIVTEANWKNWKINDFKPYLDVVYEAFGENRIMIGSDWPVCKLAGEYNQVMEIVERYFSAFPASIREKIFAKNCCDFYNIE